MFKLDKSITHFLSTRMIEFLNKPFYVYYLYPDFIEKNEPTIFDGWVGAVSLPQRYILKAIQNLISKTAEKTCACTDMIIPVPGYIF